MEYEILSRQRIAKLLLETPLRVDLFIQFLMLKMEGISSAYPLLSKCGFGRRNQFLSLQSIYREYANSDLSGERHLLSFQRKRLIRNRQHLVCYNGDIFRAMQPGYAPQKAALITANAEISLTQRPQEPFG